MNSMQKRCEAVQKCTRKYLLIIRFSPLIIAKVERKFETISKINIFRNTDRETQKKEECMEYYQ